MSLIYAPSISRKMANQASLSEYYATLDQLYAQAIALDRAPFALAQARASINFQLPILSDA